MPDLVISAFISQVYRMLQAGQVLPAGPPDPDSASFSLRCTAWQDPSLRVLTVHQSAAGRFLRRAVQVWTAAQALRLILADLYVLKKRLPLQTGLVMHPVAHLCISCSAVLSPRQASLCPLVTAAEPGCCSLSALLPQARYSFRQQAFVARYSKERINIIIIIPLCAFFLSSISPAVSLYHHCTVSILHAVLSGCTCYHT